MRELVETVQHNCDIVDARHGDEYGMCTYLLKMRELYRWQQRLPFGAPLDKDRVGDWLSAREAELDALAEADYSPVSIAGSEYDPFDAEGINAALLDQGLVYSAGLATGGRANFFLAELENERVADNGFRLRVSGRELARCLNAPPAMTRGATIFLRRESLRRYLWEKYEAWLWNRPQNAMARAIAHYPFESAVEHALDEMTLAEMATIEAHERGEYQAGLDLGPDWEEMLLHLSLTPAEIMARAVRDHLADCTHTLPMLIDDGRDASLHFFMANLSAMRKELFPSLRQAYTRWLEGADRTVFSDLVERGRDHWRETAEAMLAVYRCGRKDVAAEIAGRADACRL